MFVRDPLTRLLSVYFNKAMNTNLTSIKNFGPDVKRRGQEMIRLHNRTRPASDPDLPENRTLPTFEEFLEFIIVSSMDGEKPFIYLDLFHIRHDLIYHQVERRLPEGRSAMDEAPACHAGGRGS